ncbi:hypothetical protein WG66_001611 [Moniliophthora roreri]|nr:hypothetical protein WG66_001611 [Moniliophthora roreri]
MRDSMARVSDEDLDNALQRHMQLFERKLDVQRQELEETIKTSERYILAAMQAGAHERKNREMRKRKVTLIIDPGARSYAHS